MRRVDMGWRFDDRQGDRVGWAVDVGSRDSAGASERAAPRSTDSTPPAAIRQGKNVELARRGGSARIHAVTSIENSGTAVRPRFLARVRPWQVTLLALGLYLAAILGGAGWDPMVLVRVGTRFDPGLPGGSMGYDGQFSYQIARAPIDSVVRLDVPAYRLQRILYPAAARLMAIGSPNLIPWTLLLLNIAAVCIGVALTEAILRHFGQSRWWALAYGLNVGMFMAVRLDLTEPLAYALVQAAVLAWNRERPMWSAVAFAGAALAKEVTVIFLVGYLVACLLRDPRRAWVWGAVALAPFLLWQAVLWAWLGYPGIGSGGALATSFEILPLRGWWKIAEVAPQAFLTVSLLVVPMVIVPAVAGLVCAGKSLTSGVRASAAALLLQSAVFLFLPTSNLIDTLGSARFVIGLIAALLNFGAEVGWRRVLAYAQLWLLTLAFLPGDRFLPSG
jgi:hypothetical protein